jgi:hypothetical protein
VQRGLAVVDVAACVDGDQQVVMEPRRIARPVQDPAGRDRSVSTA